MTQDLVDRRTALRQLLSVVVLALGSPLFSDELFAAATSSAANGGPANFKAVYLDQKLKDEFYLFLQNVFHLYPENKFHQLITDIVNASQTDQEAYEAILKRVKEIKPALSELTYALPALKKQKQEMARQTVALLGSTKQVNGYVEIGTTGRYHGTIRDSIDIQGPLYVVNDVAPRFSLDDIVERGRLTKVGTFVPMGNYDVFAGNLIPENSVELVTNFIGFHHSPADKLEGFVQSVRRVLKPGGKLIVRDHDVDRPEMNSMVALAHDVFNAGLGLTWKDNHDQIRNFTSVPQLEAILAQQGLKREGEVMLQEHDPTKNSLMLFTKQSTWKA